MMGTKKVGAFPSPRKKANVIINPKRKKASDFAKYFLHAKAIVLDKELSIVGQAYPTWRLKRIELGKTVVD